MPAKGHLDRAGVVQTAASVADRDGLEAVTLASVARQLGIRIPSLYNHIAGLTGLRQEMALMGICQLADKIRRAATGKAGEDAIIGIADAYRAFTHEHPGLYAAALRVPDPKNSEMMAAGQEVVDIVLAVLQHYHLSGEDAIHAVRGLRSALHGFVDLEAADGFGLPLDCDESFQRLIHMFIRGLQQPR